MTNRYYGAKTKLRELLKQRRFYTVHELAILVDRTEQQVRQMIAVLKNPKYEDPALDLIQIMGRDRKKRWGNREAMDLINEY